MGTKDPKQNRLQRLLKNTYAQRQPVTLDHRWQSQTMRRIRNEALGDDGMRPFLIDFQNLIWRLVPTASAMILVCAILLYHFDFVSDITALQLLDYQLESYE